MSKFTVYPGEKGYEVDGCLQCGSMWFDKGELEPYEEEEVGDPSLVKTMNEKPITAGRILDLLGTILSAI